MVKHQTLDGFFKKAPNTEMIPTRPIKNSSGLTEGKKANKIMSPKKTLYLHPFTEKNFVFSGDFNLKTKEECQDLVLREGGNVRHAVSSKTDFLVLGENPGPSKLKKAREIKTLIIKEETFLEMAKKADPKEKPQTAIFRQSARPENTGELWTTKYAPKTSREIVGNRQNIELLARWLKQWPEGNTEKAILISGSPGIGKTTAAQLVTRECGFSPSETNASEYRTKGDIERMFGALAGKGIGTLNKKLVLIMDEVDGMASGDRGGLFALTELIKKTAVPLICICNDRMAQKIKTLASYCLDLRFHKPDSRQVVSRLKEIAAKEGIPLELNGIEQLVTGCGADLRSAINQLSMVAQGGQVLSFDYAKTLSKEGKKNIEENVFEAVSKLFSGTGASLEERATTYFLDTSLVPLMVEQNYLYAQGMQTLRLLREASELFSLGDCIDTMIHGTESNWSLAPLHAMVSTVLPAMLGKRLYRRLEFPVWLGKNSTRTRIRNELKEISSALSPECFRLDYLQTLLLLVSETINTQQHKQASEMLSYYRLTDVDKITGLLLSNEEVKPLSKRKAEFTSFQKKKRMA